MEAKEEGIILSDIELKATKFTKDKGWIISFEFGEEQDIAVAALLSMRGRLLNLHITESGN